NVCTLRRLLPLPRKAMTNRPLSEANIARRGIEHVDTHVLEISENYLHHRPVIAELIFILPSPLRPNLIGELGWPVEMVRSEIENARRRHDCHFQSLQPVVEADQFRHTEAAYFANPALLQADVNFPLAPISRYIAVNLQRADRRAFTQQHPD